MSAVIARNNQDNNTSVVCGDGYFHIQDLSRLQAGTASVIDMDTSYPCLYDPRWIAEHPMSPNHHPLLKLEHLLKALSEGGARFEVTQDGQVSFWFDDETEDDGVPLVDQAETVLINNVVYYHLSDFCMMVDE